MTACINSHARLASRTSAQKCVSFGTNRINTSFTLIPERLDRALLGQLLTAFRHPRPQTQPRKTLCESPNGIEYP